MYTFFIFSFEILLRNHKQIPCANVTQANILEMKINVSNLGFGIQLKHCTAPILWNKYSGSRHRKKCFKSDKACTGFWGQVRRTLTGGPGAPLRPGGPASSENLVGSRSNVWNLSVAARVTGTSEVGPTSCVLVPFGWNNFESIVVICSAWGR